MMEEKVENDSFNSLSEELPISLEEKFGDLEIDNFLEGTLDFFDLKFNDWISDKKPNQLTEIAEEESN